MIEKHKWSADDACSGCPVRRHGLCGKLPDRVRTRLAGLAHRATYPSNHTLWEQEEQPSVVSILRKGILRVQRYSTDGDRQIVAMVYPGEMVGADGEMHTGYGVDACTDVSLCYIERATFRRLLKEEHDLRRAILREYTERLDATRHQIWSFGLQSPEERLCAFLIHACSVMPYQPLPDGSGVLTVQIPRADIADLLGTTKESISRLTHRLQRLGLIDIRDPKHLLLRDLDRLAEMGSVDRETLALAVAPRQVLPILVEQADLAVPSPSVFRDGAIPAQTE